MVTPYLGLCVFGLRRLPCQTSQRQSNPCGRIASKRAPASWSCNSAAHLVACDGLYAVQVKLTAIHGAFGVVLRGVVFRRKGPVSAHGGSGHSVVDEVVDVDEELCELVGELVSSSEGASDVAHPTGKVVVSHTSHFHWRTASVLCEA